MDWSVVIVAAVVIVAFLAWKRMSLVPADTAQELLRAGALIVDVRSPKEFQSGHIPRAINVPLGRLREELPTHVTHKNQVLLLHCLSGGRSAIARQQAKRLGYPNVHNLGSYGRAEKIVRSSREPEPAA